MALITQQTPAQMAASEETLYTQKFTYALAIIGAIGLGVYAMEKNKKHKVLWAVGGLIGGIIVGYGIDTYVNGQQQPTSTIATTATPTTTTTVATN